MKFFTFLAIFVALSGSMLKAQVSFISNATCYGTLTAMNGSNGSTDTVSSWAWDFDADGAYDDALGQNTNFIFATTGSFNVGLMVTFTNGGGDTIIQTIVIDPLPEVNFFVDNLCAFDSATFTDNSSISTGTVDFHYWDFDNNGVDDDEGMVVKYNNGVTAGFYVTKLRAVSDKGCSSSTFKQNQVFNVPITNFSTSATINAGSATSFTNSTFIDTGSVIEIYVWDFGDGEGSSFETPSHEFKTAQTYMVQLIAISDRDCRDTVVKGITVDEALAVAEVFGVESAIITPNGDGFNDFLKISALDDYANCKVTIYNSWNDDSLYSDAYSNDEGGAFTARDVDAGAYYYIIECGEEPLMGVINVVK